MPMGQMPVLEVDGKKMIQSVSICRYLGKKFGIAGKNEMEDYEIDKVVDIVNDLRASKKLIFDVF
jgi:prostaglandin-H2 D-isomerase / glutathione transferase